MAALPTRMLRAVAESQLGITPAALFDSFPAYTIRAREKAIARLIRAQLIAIYWIEAENQGRYRATVLGRTAATSPTPPRWSAPRRSSPRTATIAR